MASSTTEETQGKIYINTLRPRHNSRHFTDDIFKFIFLNENVWISLKISPKFVPNVRINNIAALVSIMARCQPGDKPLSERIMVGLLTHICVTRPQWVHPLFNIAWYIVYPKKYAHGFSLLCFVVVIHWLIFPYPSGLLHWHCGNLTIAPVPAKQPWWIWINTLCEFILNDCITTTKQSTTKPCAYFLGYTVILCGVVRCGLLC